MSQPQDNITGLFKHISLKAPVKPKLSNLPVFQLKPSLATAKQSFSLPKLGLHKTAEKAPSEPFIPVDDVRSEASLELQKPDGAEPSRKRSLEPPFDLPASKRAKVIADTMSDLDQVEPPAESAETMMVQEKQSNDAEIAHYQDYFVEKNNEYEKMLEAINNELESTSEGLKELSVKLLTTNNELLTYNNPIFFGLNPHLEKEE